VAPTEILDIAREAIWVLIQVAGPVMAVGLIVGLLISVLQSITQIQEMTLAFVPKIVAVFFALSVLMPYMIQVLGDFMRRLAELIATT
jgi:flagellar biosynthetic protein FliQ